MSDLRTRRYLFNSEESAVAFFDKNKVEIFEIRNAAKIYSYQLEENKKIIIDAVFIKNTNQLIIQSAEVEQNAGNRLHPWKYIQNELLLHDYRSNQKEKISLEEVTVLQPSLWYDSAKDAYFFGHTEGYSYIKIEN